MATHLAVDVGGTFIDFVHFDPATQRLKVEKIPSSGALVTRFFEGIDALGVSFTSLDTIVHGSTQVVNTIVQENGAKVGLITSRGFRDVLELGRGSRPEVYNLFYKPPPPLVPRYLRFEVAERLDHKGNVLQSLDEEELERCLRALQAEGVEGVAICFLHAYANPVHERRAAELSRQLFPELQVCTSSDIVREFREFERTSTTVLNAYTQPRMSRYLTALECGLNERNYRGSFAVMQSSGGMTSSAVAQGAPIRTVQSGPAGGVMGTAALGRQLGLDDLVAADVGGTTFDVALITGGTLLKRNQTSYNGRPVLQTTIDIVSIGAGGGSLAYVDAEGGLRVGPQSAQADPGPACFGLGGERATVTDAQLVLGYLNPGSYLGERMKLNLEAARRAVQSDVAAPLQLSLEDAAAGVLHLANMNMSYAVRQVTLERGHDPRDFSLVSYGGGGGLFAGALLRELEMRRVIVPRYPATFSAYGLLNADYREDVSRTFIKPHAEVPPSELAERFGGLEFDAKTWFEDQGLASEKLTVERFAELRYLGQEHTLKIPIEVRDLSAGTLAELRDRFDVYYEQAYGHALREHGLEFVGLRLSASLQTEKPSMKSLATASSPVHEAVARQQDVFIASQKRWFSCPVYTRDKLRAGHALTGPALVEEWDSTVLVLPEQTLQVDAYGNLILEAIT